MPDIQTNISEKNRRIVNAVDNYSELIAPLSETTIDFINKLDFKSAVLNETSITNISNVLEIYLHTMCNSNQWNIEWRQIERAKNNIISNMIDVGLPESMSPDNNSALTWVVKYCSVKGRVISANAFVIINNALSEDYVEENVVEGLSWESTNPSTNLCYYNMFFKGVENSSLAAERLNVLKIWSDLGEDWTLNKLNFQAAYETIQSQKTSDDRLQIIVSLYNLLKDRKLIRESGRLSSSNETKTIIRRYLILDYPGSLEVQRLAPDKRAQIKARATEVNINTPIRDYQDINFLINYLTKVQRPTTSETSNVRTLSKNFNTLSNEEKAKFFSDNLKNLDSETRAELLKILER